MSAMADRNLMASSPKAGSHAAMTHRPSGAHPRIRWKRRAWRGTARQMQLMPKWGSLTQSSSRKGPTPSTLVVRGGMVRVLEKEDHLTQLPS